MHIVLGVVLILFTLMIPGCLLVIDTRGVEFCLGVCVMTLVNTLYIWVLYRNYIEKNMMTDINKTDFRFLTDAVTVSSNLNGKCSVCRESLTLGNRPLLMFSCSHIFHNSCTNGLSGRTFCKICNCI